MGRSPLDGTFLDGYVMSPAGGKLIAQQGDICYSYLYFCVDQARYYSDMLPGGFTTYILYGSADLCDNLKMTIHQVV